MNNHNTKQAPQYPFSFTKQPPRLTRHASPQGTVSPAHCELDWPDPCTQMQSGPVTCDSFCACADSWTELSGVSEGSVSISANRYEDKLWECHEPDKSA